MPRNLMQNAVKPGDRFGKLVVASEAYRKCTGKTEYWHCNCQCDCQTLVPVAVKNLLSGNTKTCGCGQREMLLRRNTTHGQSRSRLYRIWAGIVKRCEDNGSLRYGHYGGRGITIHPEWRTNFVAFRDWAIANGYRDDLTVERVDVDGNYEPGNCTWIPLGEQPNNRTVSRRITAFGETKTLADWIHDPRCKVTSAAITKRIDRGVPAELAITQPPKTGKHKKRYDAALRSTRS